MGSPDRWSGDRPESGSRWRSLLGRSRTRGTQAPPTPSPPPEHTQYPRRNPPPPHQAPPPYQSQPPAAPPAQRRSAPVENYPSAESRRQSAPSQPRRGVPPQQLRPAAPDPQIMERLRRPLSRSKVVAFINPKGGVHKTTATVLTAAALGTARGSGVIAWDDNELRGTLGLRAGTARHARTIRHLVEHLPQVEAAGVHLPEHLDEFLRHSSDGSFDVLAGDEDPKLQRHLDPSTVLRVLDILTRTHNIICIDTGNNVESPNWRTVVSSVDRLVVTTVPREDAAFAADWMLDLLEENGYGHLVSEAVTLLSCPTPNPGPLLNDFTRHFKSRTGSVAVVPYDPALEPGAKIEFSALRDATRVAWMSAAATILEGL
ncbi:MinD/ParA family ATP-binding protein [Natronoglycomyces albus]|uniref:Chromosome partitioning ATPase n=1 Tax=Natronoglycomyces albus TaxID=2811108 RepID=A0A895XMK7_9ACTN|nr:chromosome partitioning ATPase [Natronoglycomyces albus]QSB04245.1 chromosome partitioning ATPase [Natronoglycomyces albus]